MSEVLLQQILSELKDVKTGQQRAEKRFDTIDERLNAMDARFDGIDKRLDAMDKRFDSMQGQIDSMQTQMNGMHGQIDSMQTQMNGMQGQIDSMQTQITDLQSQADRIEARQETIFEQTAFLSEFKEKTVVRLENTATKDDLQYIEAKLMEHDRELFNLKKRA
ncbi:hypothetical protein NCCP2716_21850 [Sporosarcina sp. NCCP-2716]|uniref:hypothetical protein n=1 Tax=Sporosarcina sp. NCCP-2716 TaxID=2943679 RepID=UPI0020404C73|nr:hypothetical protein [Sporosarcina sp. NCCP-2716]GKV69687.1 hypothetical protein NCCP2716_21850 [Sporosarcina sp. NCCP-2716]